MTEISVVGLGSMGSSLARALMRSGRKTTVWNRTPDKTNALNEGATVAASLLHAIEASPLILVCIDNYASTRDLLSPASIASALAERTLIQFSTGSPKEAREAAAWFKDLNANYLDGAIMAYPSEIGRPDTLILICGDEVAFQTSEPCLSCLGSLRYLGSNPSMASALDLALLSYIIGAMLGLFHGALICESESTSVSLLGSLIEARAILMGKRARDRTKVIESGKFGESEARLGMWKGALQRVADQAHDAGMDGEFPKSVLRIFDRATAAGFASEDVSAIIKVMRNKRNA